MEPMKEDIFDEDWEGKEPEEYREDRVKQPMINNLVQSNRRTKLILGYMVGSVALLCALLSLHEGFMTFAVLSIIVSLGVALATYLWSKKKKKN